MLEQFLEIWDENTFEHRMVACDLMEEVAPAVACRLRKLIEMDTDQTAVGEYWIEKFRMKTRRKMTYHSGQMPDFVAAAEEYNKVFANKDL